MSAVEFALEKQEQIKFAFWAGSCSLVVEHLPSCGQGHGFHHQHCKKQTKTTRKKTEISAGILPELSDLFKIQ
jgi:hypothetical protein